MPYTVELFNQFNEFVEKSRNAVSRCIQYLLKPDDGYPKNSDDKLKEFYDMWRANCRAMDAACEENVHLNARCEMIEMPADDKEHLLCRRMAAVIIERNIFGEHIAQEYLPELVEKLKASNCHTHPKSCACHQLTGWTYLNQDIMNTLLSHYLEKNACCNTRNGCSSCVGGAPLSYQPAMGGGAPVAPKAHHVDCACGECYRGRVANGTADAHLKKLQEATNKVLSSIPSRYTSPAKHADDAISAAQKMPGGDTDVGFAKNLFQTVQGVKFDDKCPHGLPFYACMACSH